MTVTFQFKNGALAPVDTQLVHVCGYIRCDEPLRCFVAWDRSLGREVFYTRA